MTGAKHQPLERRVRAGLVLAVVGAFLAAAAGASATPRIYWTNLRSTISEANLDGSSVNRTFIPAYLPTAIAVDGRHIYWINFRR